MGLKKRRIGKLTPNEFVSGFFGHKPASVRVTHNPNLVRSKFMDQWGIGPERALSWSTLGEEGKTGVGKALIFVNKKLPEYMRARGDLRRSFELEHSLVYELANVYVRREGKVSEYMHSTLTNLIALEYFAKTNPSKLRVILRASLSERNAKRFLVPKRVLEIYQYLNASQREQLINDILRGKISNNEKDLGNYLLNIVKKLPRPPTGYITQLEEEQRVIRERELEKEKKLKPKFTKGGSIESEEGLTWST